MVFLFPSDMGISREAEKDEIKEEYLDSVDTDDHVTGNKLYPSNISE